MATKSKIEAEIKKFKNILSNDKKSDFIKKKAKTQIKKLEDELAKIGSKVVKGAKKLADMTDEEFAKEKKKLENKLGKTEEECENILKEYKEQRAKAGRQRANEKKRVATMQKKKETTTPTSNEKNLKTILSDNADKVDDKLDKEVNNIKSEAKREAKKKVADKNLTTAQKQKKIDEIVQFEVKKKTKAIADKVALETKSVISAISVKLSSIDKQLRLTYLRKVKAEVESMISKMMFGGLTDGATQNLNVTQSQMSAESVNPQFAKGGGVDNPPFQINDMVYSYQNPNHKMRVSQIEDRGIHDGVHYWGYKVALKVDEDGNYDPNGKYSQSSKWMDSKSMSFNKKETYARGGKTKGLEHFLRNADKITTKDGKVVSKSEFIKMQKEKEDFEKGLDDLYPNLSDDYKKGKFNKGGGVRKFAEGGYNGWTNYATWVTHLEMMDGLEWDEYNQGEPITKEILEQFVDESLDMSPELTRSNADRFLSDVNYYEIAEHINDNFGLSDGEEGSKYAKGGEVEKLDKEYYAELEKLGIDRYSYEASQLWNKKYRDRYKKVKHLAKGGNIGESVENQILEMLRENTGTHFLDSGGKDGRMWQKNQTKIFQKEPRVSYEIYNGEIVHSVSLFHYLNEILEEDYFSYEVNKFIQELAEESSEYHYINSLDEEIEMAFPQIEYKGEVINTYNGEENISQTILFRPFLNTETDEVYVLLQIHNGADVRGGYTLTRCFKLEGYLTGFVDVYGTIDGQQVENTYNGYSLTTEDGEEVEVKEDSDVSLDFVIMDDTYMYKDYAKGGKTWIDSGKNNVHTRGTKGTFRAKAEKKGMTSGEYARKVLKDPKSTKAERKSAQFVENIGVKEEGGEIMTADTQMEFADGGRLFDDLKINKGAFTKKAKQRGLSTQDFMRKVLANPSRYDERTRKQAQLMKNMM